MPVAVSSSQKWDKKFFYTLCHWLNGWEGVKKRNESEDLPNAKKRFKPAGLRVKNHKYVV